MKVLATLQPRNCQNCKIMANTVFYKSRLISPILRNSSLFQVERNQLKVPIIVTVQNHRYSYRASNPVRDLKEYPEVEIRKNPPEWKFVERLLPKEIVPPIKSKNEFPSGWKPPQPLNTSTTTKYYIERTKNHMIPVYLLSSFNHQRKITLIKRIHGDIWSLEKELRNVVERTRNGKLCASQINELCGQIKFHGNYVDVIKMYLQEKGF